MDVEHDNRAQVLSELLHTKGWHRVLPVPAIDLLTAVIDDGSRLRDAIDARLRRSPDSPAGLSTLVWLSGSRSRQHSLAELLDLLTASGVLTVDHRGEYQVDMHAPSVHDSSSQPLVTLLTPGHEGRALVAPNSFRE